MRRLSRVYEPAIEAAIGRTAGQHPSNYVCRRCLRRGTASQLSTPSAPFSTSAFRPAGLGLDKFSSAMKGETSMFDKQGEKSDEDYKPAETWEDLEWIGTKQWYERQKRPQKPFQGYGRITAPLKDRMVIRDELLKAIVEVFTIRKAAPDAWKELLRRATVDDGKDFPTGIRLGCDSNTKDPIIEFEDSEMEKQFLDHLQKTVSAERQAVAQETSALEASEAKVERSLTKHDTFTFADLKDQTSGKWSSIDLGDLDFRFAIAKRVQQRTGIRLTDPQFTQANTAGAMFVHLWTPEKPKKLAEGLLSNEELVNLPNVKIADHRVTFVHRERDVGRWKVIEEELTDRGIPPLGRPGYKKRSAKV